MLVRQDDDFPAGAPPGTILLRDCDGLLAQALAQMRAGGVLLRPDRYVLAAWNQADAAQVMRAVEALLEAARTGSPAAMPG